MKKILVNNISAATEAFALALVSQCMSENKNGWEYKGIRIRKTKETEEYVKYTVSGGYQDGKA